MKGQALSPRRREPILSHPVHRHTLHGATVFSRQQSPSVNGYRYVNAPPSRNAFATHFKYKRESRVPNTSNVTLLDAKRNNRVPRIVLAPQPDTAVDGQSPALRAVAVATVKHNFLLSSPVAAAEAAAGETSRPISTQQLFSELKTSRGAEIVSSQSRHVSTDNVAADIADISNEKCQPHLAPLCTHCGKTEGSSRRRSSNQKNNDSSGKVDNAQNLPNISSPRSPKPLTAELLPSERKYIIASKSFTEASTHFSGDAKKRGGFWNDTVIVTPDRQRRLSAQVPGSPNANSMKPLFHRSSIVKQEILLGAASLKDYYDINIKNLGKGSYGSVVAARDLRTGATRAVKIVYKPKIENITRLKREILIMKRLDHPNIIRLFEVFEDEKDLYLVMELCTGGELFDRIIKFGHFSERYAASIMKQILSAISYCHSNNVMHRDLKPENVLYSDSSPLSALKVIDWGFAAKCTKNHKFSSVVGTPYYVAPEVLFGNYDRQCDVWSAGVILYILLSGFPPFHGKDNKEILRKVKIGEFSFDAKYWNKISEQAKNMIRGLLAFEPRKRMTAAVALHHPWLQYYTQATSNQESPLTNKLGGDLLEKFRNFQRHNKLKKLALTVVAYQMAEKDIGKLHEIFSALDKNGDGVLTISEVSAGLAHMNVKYGEEIVEILEELDTDGNGTIDYTEFIAASLDHKLYEQEAVCRSAFRIFDLDGDGRITVDEMREVLQMSFLQEAFSSEMIGEMVKEVDTNNDGSIDFEEFMKMMRGNQKKKLDASPFSKARALLYRKLEQ